MKKDYIEKLILELEIELPKLEVSEIAQRLEIIRAELNTEEIEIKKEGDSTYRVIT